MPPQYVWPPPLQPGDGLAVLAPASPISSEAMAAGAEVLSAWGFRLLYGPEVFAPRPYEAAVDVDLAQRLHQAISDPAVKGIICARGGYGTIRLLPHLDPTLLAAHPKCFMGFSDITTLLCRFSQQAGIITYHGPTVAHLAEIWPEAQEHCRQALTQTWPAPLTFTDLQVLVPGQAQGPLLGGNLAILASLLGTPYAPALAGHVLFLEDYNEPLYRIDRLLQQLRLSGSLQGVAAILLGGFTGGGPVAQVWDLLAAYGNDLDIPILAGLPVGHQPDNFTLPCGALAQVDGLAGAVRIQVPPSREGRP